MQKQKVLSIVGPTASGKTSLSIAIAKKFSGEVISADSRQVYKGLDIGSGKVTEAEMDGIQHHLLDVVDPTTVYTGADFKRNATDAIEDILDRKNVPVIAGGTFFYVELLRGTMQAAPVEPNYEFRKSLETVSDTELLARIKEKDPVRGEKIDPHNRRRLIRALEIIHTLGAVPTVSTTETPYDWLTIGIKLDQETVHKNIRTRLDQRFNDGMIDEVTELLSQGVSHERLEALGLEYRYISLFLRGELTEKDMKEQLEIKIRQFAKRQLTWLKRDGEIVWVEPENRVAIFRLIDQFLSSQ